MRLQEVFQDEKGYYSSTRLVGISSAFALIAVAMAQAFSPYVVDVNERLVEALEYVTISCLLWAQVGKFANKKTPQNIEQESTE